MLVRRSSLSSYAGPGTTDFHGGMESDCLAAFSVAFFGCRCASGACEYWGLPEVSSLHHFPRVTCLNGGTIAYLSRHPEACVHAHFQARQRGTRFVNLPCTGLSSIDCRSACCAGGGAGWWRNNRQNQPNENYRGFRRHQHLPGFPRAQSGEFQCHCLRDGRRLVRPYGDVGRFLP
ncbi:hypothetical protein D9M72_523460 [compost metagenome]